LIVYGYTSREQYLNTLLVPNTTRILSIENVITNEKCNYLYIIFSTTTSGSQLSHHILEQWD